MNTTRYCTGFLWLALAVGLLAPAACANNNDSDSDGQDGQHDAGDDVSNECQAAPMGRVALPEDDGRHSESVEWWYWTGHLQTEDGRWFGFEEAIFQFGGSMHLANFAITDIEDESFHYKGKMSFDGQSDPEDGFDLIIEDEDTGPVSAVGGDGADLLKGMVDDYELELTLTANKPPVPHHEDGYHDYAVGGYTYYYSRTRMTAEGTITIAGQQSHVEGSAWFDHQWGDLSKVTDTGWDWFGIQLDDGREIMLFLLLDDQGTLAGGTIVGTDCQAEEISPDTLQVTPLDTWTSPNTGCEYPMGWDISIDDLSFSVTPVMEDQELASEHQNYWEGVSIVTGDVTGRAYVELTGHCEEP